MKYRIKKHSATEIASTEKKKFWEDIKKSSVTSSKPSQIAVSIRKDFWKKRGA